MALLWLVLTAGAAPSSAAPACSEITAFVRAGCPHCAAAKTYLHDLQARHPDLKVAYRDVQTDPEAFQHLAELNRRNGIDRLGVPSLAICDQLLVGFDRPETTGAAIEALITGADAEIARGSAINLPWLGSVSATGLGLPLFTVAVGLVDGFNPCAMWVLLFLLSVLVNVRRRSRILMVAGTFVLVSGVVYFAFMVAWLNVFMIVGFSRPLQLTLGVLALGIGVVHVKDFFALHRGPSLSIPEAAKPGLYARVRRVVHAENLWIALVGVILLAILVNFIELLCTAGLPALYTQILTLHGLSDWQYYGYLALYNLAYVFDDGVMVALAVVTLGRHKLQEREGRWLKLVSGALILVLGALLVAAPGLLVF